VDHANIDALGALGAATTLSAATTIADDDDDDTAATAMAGFVRRVGAGRAER
jgi:hypothetical protein